MEIFKFPLKSKSDRLTEETFLRLNRSCQRGLGIWPEDNLRKVFPVTIFCLSCYLLTSISQAQFVYTHSSDYKQLLMIISPAGTYFVSLVKVVSLMTKRKAVREILSFFKKEWISETSAKNIEVIYEFTRLSHMYGAFLCVSIFSTWIIFVVLATILNVYSLLFGEYARLIPFPSDYPFDVKTSPNFEIAFVFVSWGAFLTIYSMTAVDGSFIELNIHLAGQFKIVQTELKHLIVNEIDHRQRDINGNYNFSVDELNRLHTRLCKIVRKHVDVIKMCEKFVKTYTFNIFLHFLTSALLVCMACINITIFTGLDKFKFLFLGLLTLTQLYLYSAGGSYIEQYSQGVADAAYSVYWYETDDRIRKVLQLIILRSQRGTVIRVPFFQVSAKSFITILQTAGSYISLFNAVL